MVNTITVICNSQLSALSRACILCEERLGITLNVAVFSSVPLTDLLLPERFICYYGEISTQPRVEEYRVLTNSVYFRESQACLLFFTRLVPKLVHSKKLTINFHPSLLPMFPGLTGFNSAIKAKQLAMTAHVVDDTVDGGRVLSQMAINPFPPDTNMTQLREESSLLCSASIILVLNQLKAGKQNALLNFNSGAQCIESTLLNCRSVASN